MRPPCLAYNTCTYYQYEDNDLTEKGKTNIVSPPLFNKLHHLEKVGEYLILDSPSLSYYDLFYPRTNCLSLVSDDSVSCCK